MANDNIKEIIEDLDLTAKDSEDTIEVEEKDTIVEIDEFDKYIEDNDTVEVEW